MRIYHPFTIAAEGVTILINISSLDLDVLPCGFVHATLAYSILIALRVAAAQFEVISAVVVLHTEKCSYRFVLNA